MSHSSTYPQTTSMIDKHFILATCPAFSHVRSEISLVCKLVAADPHLMFTIFSAKFFVPNILKEITRASGTPADSLTRIRVIGAGKQDPPPLGATMDVIGNMWLVIGEEQSEAYRELVKEDSLTCTTTGRTFDYHNIPKPSLVMVDVFVAAVGPAVKEVTPEVVVVTPWPGVTCSFLSHFGPEEYGGLEDVDVQARAILEKQGGASYDEIVVSLYNTTNGKLYPNAGGIRMFDYENTPQATFPVRIPLPIPVLMGAVRLVNQYSDAAWINAARSFQPKNVQVMEDWYGGKLGKKVFYVGPQGAPAATADGAGDGSKSRSDVMAFLDAQPPKSVIYISFGTIFYPIEQLWRIETLVTTLLETRTPFLFSRASQMFVPFSPKLEKALAESGGIGMAVDFVPQNDALDHPSMSAFLTHGGANSMNESILAGVLNIYWPQTADQPLHAAYMTENLDCAFELIQVRTGVGAGPPARGGKVEGTPEAVAAEFKQILADIKGPVGERKRKNLGAIRQRILEDMKAGGECHTAIKGLLDLGTPKK
ncbi:hypothetical protein FRB94_012430 [Tulasnella sp. JGI-2019a]|nr:hypothetical protein FRB94_012430 [Tulasnella sp. JGI-2019a]KAG9007262.1 hypothetical protein FRB93_008085 [Tulasnella sp. JGI-2019a]KAG9033570.1 hypothetical protein FRB95_014648 [Tulasnella sp. JGI-2019a]